MKNPCIELHAPHLAARHEELVKSGISEKEAGFKVAMEEHQKLHKELNDFKKSIGKEETPYTVWDKSKEVEDIKKEYEQKIGNILLQSEKIGKNGIVSEEQINIAQPVINKVSKSEPVNEKELSDAQDVLYEALDKHPEAAHLIEPLISKLQDYEFTTTTETRRITEKVPVKTAGTAGYRKPVSKSIDQWEGNRATITDKNGKKSEGVIKVEDGKYYLYNEAGEKVAALGEKSITDRDISLPSKEDVPMPITIDKDGNVESITLQLNKVVKDTGFGGVLPDKLITINFRDKEKALDYAIQLRAEQIGVVPNKFFGEKFKEVKRDIPVEVFTKTKASVLVAPYYDTQIKTVGDAAALRESDGYKAHVEMLHSVAEKMGLKVTKVDDTIGGFKNKEGNEITEISNRVHLNTTDINKAEQYAALVGALSHEVQEATIASKYVEHGNAKQSAVEAEIKVSDLQGAIDALKESGITDYEADVAKSTIKVLDFSNGKDLAFDEKMVKFADALDKQGIEHGTRVHSIESRYVDPAKRTELLKEAESSLQQRQSGADLRDIYKEAAARSEEFLSGKSVDGKNNTGSDGVVRSEQGGGVADNKQAPVNNSLTTQQFFSDTVNGSNQPKRPWKPLLPIQQALQKVYDTWTKFRGGFDSHIETNIPVFRDVQIRKIDAIANTLKDGGVVIDLGGSEGGFGKAISEINPKIKTVNLDMNSDMEAAHNKLPVAGAEFVKEAFGEDVDMGDGVVVKKHVPKEKADVVHESMLFQFITPERESFIKEIADNYVKPDGVVIIEEKVIAENWGKNEFKKDKEFKTDFYDDAAIAKKQEEVVTGMKGNQAQEQHLLDALSKEFKYVHQYWDSGNFKGYIASNNKVKAIEMRDAIGDTKSDYSSREKLVAIEDGVVTNQPDYLQGSAAASTGTGSKTKELDVLANNIPDSGRITEYMSKDTIEKYTGETPTNDQTRGVQELDIALTHGKHIIDTAKKIFGKDYAEKTIDYIDNSTLGVSNKALMYVSLENALGQEKLANPNRAAEITKQQALVYAKSQAFARENSLALNYQKLRKVAQVGYDMAKVTDNFFSAEELAAKKELSKSIEADADTINKEAEAMEAAGMTPEIEQAIRAGVEKEVNKIHENLPASFKKKANDSIAALEKIQARLRNKTYDASIGIPVAIIDAGISTIKLALKAGIKIADAIEMGIAKIKELHGQAWDKESEFRKDMLEGFKEKSDLSVKDFTRDALIAKGFGREITVKGEVRQILDWKKMAGEAGTVSKISEHVAEMLDGSKFTPAEIEAAKTDFINEYIDIRESVIQKGLNELGRRNKATVTPEQKSAAKKLAELYTYGLFESKEIEFENTLNRALGVEVGEKGYNDARKIAEAMETIFSSSFKGVPLSEVSAKAAIHKLEDQLRILLHQEAKKQGNNNLRLASIVRGYFDFQQTMILNNLKQAVENPFSGLQQNIMEKINGLTSKDGIGTGEMANQRRKLMADVYKDMVINGAVGYGKVDSVFVNRSHIDDAINKMSDNQLYHTIASVVTGRATLNAMDAMWKAGITEKKFATNLIKIMTHETNPNKMSKEDAVKFVSEKLTGQSFTEAQVTAKELIEKINKDAGEKLIPDNQTSVDRLANDIVKAALEMGGKITPDQITAAYNAAYKSAGLGLGHEPNNIISSQVMAYTQKLEDKINQSLKNKEWNRAAMLTAQSIIFRNVLNPFVGGGTNWLVLKFEKTGLGLFTGLGYQLASNTKLDFTSEMGMKKMEERLYNQARVKDNYVRGLVGGVTSALTYLAFTGIADTEEYRKWRGKNMWAARYLDIFTPEALLAEMAIKNKSVKKYAASTFNRNDAFDATTKVIKAADFAITGKTDKAMGALGEAVGSKFNAPVPWRLVKDGQVLYQGITGKDPYHGDYQPSKGFFNGVFQGGAIEWAGWRPSPKTK